MTGGRIRGRFLARIGDPAATGPMLCKFDQLQLRPNARPRFGRPDTRTLARTG